MVDTTSQLVLRTDDARGVTTLTLNRPAAFNALSEELLTDLQNTLDDLAKDKKLRVLIIAASGKAFCAGHDLREMRADPSLHYYQKLFAQCGRMMMGIQTLHVPVIAKVQGIATAAGCQLVAQCDLAVARKAAFEMLVTGDFISAQEAMVKGLVNLVAPPDALDAKVEELVSKILSKPSVALAMGKELFYKQIETGIDGAYTIAANTMACNMMDDSALEGVQAFLEKRTPQW